MFSPSSHSSSRASPIVVRGRCIMLYYLKECDEKCDEGNNKRDERDRINSHCSGGRRGVNKDVSRLPTLSRREKTRLL